MQFPVTPSQAVANIRQWCGNPNLELVQGKVWIADESLYNQTVYLYGTPDSVQTFSVNCQSGYIVHWRNDAVAVAAESKFLSLNVMDKLPLMQLREICNSFISARFPGFATKNMQPTCEAMPYVSLYARFPNGVWDWGNNVICRADEWTGEIYYYDSTVSSPSSRSVEYAITKQSAEQAATACFQAWVPNPSESSFIIEHNYGVWLMRDSNDNGPLVWRITFALANEPGITTADLVKSATGMTYSAYEIEVDANTGQIVNGPAETAPYEGHESYDPYAGTPEMSLESGIYDSVLSIALTSITENATIRYTTNGTTPTESSTEYTSPVAVNNSLTLKAKAWKTDYLPSGVKTATYELKLPTPTFNPDAGAYQSAQNVTIFCAIANASIMYTLDDSEPTEQSLAYTGPVSIDHSLTLKAKAFKTGWTASDIKSAFYYIGDLPAPTFNPDGGTYQAAQDVTISCAVSGSTIRYTTDGTNPTESSAVYTGPVAVNQSCTLKAKAWKTGWNASDIASAAYELKLPTPAFNPDGGTYQGTQNVTISCTISGATIRYTADGNDPTESSAEYTAPVAISQSCTLKAKAFKTGWTSSDLKSADYIISP